MFHAFQTAARRAASRSSTGNFNPVTATAQSSMAAAAALILVALAGERQGDDNNSAECQQSTNFFAHEASSDSTSTSTSSSRPYRNFVATSSSSRIAQCEHTSAGVVIPDNHPDLRLQRAATSRRMAAEKSLRTFFAIYEVDFDNPLGSGAYGDVYLCRDRYSGELCALKKIPKEFTVDAEFQREMNALLHIRAHGGHPNICMLRENFDEQDDYLLVLDLVDGGEMFSALIKHGAYSEADASRLLRQVASALDFCHGIGVVHAGKFVMDLSVSISKVIVFMIHDG